MLSAQSLKPNPHLMNEDPKYCNGSNSRTILLTSVPDPGYFGTDPVPRIRTTDLRFRIRIPLWIWLFLLSGLQDANKKKFIKKCQNNRNQGFPHYFCLMIEGSGSVHLTNKSESGRSKNFGTLLLTMTFVYIWWSCGQRYFKVVKRNSKS